MRSKLLQAFFGLRTGTNITARQIPTCIRVVHMPTRLSQLVGTHGAPFTTRTLLPPKKQSFSVIAMRLHLASVLGGKKKKKKRSKCSKEAKPRKGFNKCQCPKPPRQCPRGSRTKIPPRREGSSTKCARKPKGKKKKKK